MIKVIDFIEQLQKYNPSSPIIFCAVEASEALHFTELCDSLKRAGDLHGTYYEAIGDAEKPLKGNITVATIILKQL